VASVSVLVVRIGMIVCFHLSERGEFVAYGSPSVPAPLGCRVPNGRCGLAHAPLRHHNPPFVPYFSVISIEYRHYTTGEAGPVPDPSTRGCSWSLNADSACRTSEFDHARPRAQPSGVANSGWVGTRGRVGARATTTKYCCVKCPAVAGSGLRRELRACACRLSGRRSAFPLGGRPGRAEEVDVEHWHRCQGIAAVYGAPSFIQARRPRGAVDRRARSALTY
jgi:hypothetical protein